MEAPRGSWDPWTGTGPGPGTPGFGGSRKPESSAGAPRAPWAARLAHYCVPSLLICLLCKVGGEAPEEMKLGCGDGGWVGGDGEGTTVDRVARATSLKR